MNISSNWTNLIKPKRYLVDKINNKNSIFTIAPIERGLATIIGNSLRRVMLSYIYGNSICAIKIDGVNHEYDVIKGIKEDVSEIILNFKSLLIKGSPIIYEEKFVINVSKVGEVRGYMINTPDNFSIVNPEILLMTITKEINIKIELIVKSGRGYVTSDEHNFPNTEKKYISIDSMFSPVRKCSFKVSDIKTNSQIECESLTLNIITNGTMDAELILILSARILAEQLKIFIGLKEKNSSEKSKKKELLFNKNLFRRVSDLELSVRSQNCLKNDNIIYIGDLVKKSENKMLSTPNFGKKSLNEIKELLEKMNLKLGMKSISWPPKDLQILVKQYLEKK